jgi:hypothetical protein
MLSAIAEMQACTIIASFVCLFVFLFEMGVLQMSLGRLAWNCNPLDFNLLHNRQVLPQPTIGGDGVL